jgi:hypothetical protein
VKAGTRNVLEPILLETLPTTTTTRRKSRERVARKKKTRAIANQPLRQKSKTRKKKISLQKTKKKKGTFLHHPSRLPLSVRSLNATNVIVITTDFAITSRIRTRSFWTITEKSKTQKRSIEWRRRPRIGPKMKRSLTKIRLKR